MSRHVAVLMGGWSAEREVSLVSGAGCARGAARREATVAAIDVGRDLPQCLVDAASRTSSSTRCTGAAARTARVQGVLEIMGIPYTHSGVLASALAMDKPMAKRLFASAGLRCAGGRRDPLEALRNGGRRWRRPTWSSRNDEGSSVGVSIVRDRRAADRPQRTGRSARRCWSSGTSRAASSPSP